jgi:hypothetical protein
MSGKRVTIGGVEYGLANDQVDTVLDQVRNAMGTGSVEALSLLSSANRPVTVYVNGKVVATVEVDLDGDSRPSEIC